MVMMNDYVENREIQNIDYYGKGIQTLGNGMYLLTKFNNILSLAQVYNTISIAKTLYDFSILAAEIDSFVDPSSLYKLAFNNHVPKFLNAYNGFNGALITSLGALMLGTKALRNYFSYDLHDSQYDIELADFVGISLGGASCALTLICSNSFEDSWVNDVWYAPIEDSSLFLDLFM